MKADPPVLAVGAELPSMDAGHAVRRTVDRQTHPRKRKPKRSGGSAVKRRFALLNWFADEGMRALRRRSEIGAWLGLYRHAKPDGTVSASVADLARRAGCSDRAMGDALRRLRQLGYVERIKRGTLAGGPSVWRLGIPDEPAGNRKPAAG